MKYTMEDTGKGIFIRVGGIRIMDVIATILGGLGIAYYMKWPVPLTLFVAFVIGIIVHRLFHVRTTVDKFLFPHEY